MLDRKAVVMFFSSRNNDACDDSMTSTPEFFHLNYSWGDRSTIGMSVHDRLEKLISHLDRYDKQRWELENCIVGLDDYKKITEILNTPVEVFSFQGASQVKLKTPETLRNAIRAVDFDLRIDVRRLDTGMPAYYICRVNQDYWGEYCLIVEDIYMSHGYPLMDERFVGLMSMGHETYHIRLSQFREGVAKLAKAKDPAGQVVDEILCHIGRHIFQAAWHEDQRLGITAANSFGLKHFRDCVELLYLCLSGELCELRSAVDKSMVTFFQSVYPQPAIHTFLELLCRIDGEGLNTFPRRAMQLYGRLSRAFSRFLSIEVTWGCRGMKTPIWKLLYGNFSRVDLLGKSLRANEHFKEGCNILEDQARDITNELLIESGNRIHKGN